MIPTSRTDVAALLRGAGVPRAEELASLALPCVVLTTRPAGRETRTRIGGLPDLAVDRQWPRSRYGSPLTFIGQIDLAVLAGTAVAGELPPEGLLGWFCETQIGPPDFAITFAPARSRLRTYDAPNEAAVLPGHELEVEAAWSLPAGLNSPFLKPLGLTDAEHFELSDFVGLWRSDHMPRGNQLLGYAPSSSLDDPYVDAALSFDEDLRSRWFARPVADRVYASEELAAAARRFRFCAAFNEQYVPEMGGDGAWLSFFLSRAAWERGDLNQQSPTREASTYFPT